MANLGNTIINGILRVNGKINVGESITAPSFIGDLTGNATTATNTQGTLIIQKNGTQIGTFNGANSTINITVPTKTSELTNDSNFATSSDVSKIGIHYIEGSGSIAAVTTSPYYAARWKGTDETITSLYSGLTIAYKLDVNGNGSYGTVLNINNLGEHPVVVSTSSMISTRYPVGSIVLLTYDAVQTATAYINSASSSTITGCWKIADYDSTNIYQLRNNNTIFTPYTALYRYMVLFRKSEAQLLPVNAVNNSTATTKTLTTEAFDPFGDIYYYNNTATVNAGSSINSQSLYTKFNNFDLRYSFNTGTTLTANRDVYVVCVPQGDGKVKLHTSPISQTLPTTADGYVYIFLGRAWSTYQIEMNPYHPVYYYKNGALRIYTNKDESVIKDLSVSGKTITYTRENGTTGTITTQDTTYTFTNGLSNSNGTVSNSGVRSIATGNTNGTISVNTNGTNTEVAVKGLGSNAYTSTEFTQASILPNNSGEIKTKYRISQKATTGGSTTYWYYPLCRLPVNNDGNYASAIISGRIGGWVAMSSITALVWNRGGEGIALLDIAGTATTMGNIWNTCNIVVYKNTDNSSTVYLKCASYFTFDLDLELFQSSASILYDGTYLTETPSGTLSAQADTSTKRAELYNGKLYIAGKEVFTTNGGTITGALNFSGNDSRIITWNDGAVQQRIRTVDNSTTNDSVFEFQQSIDSGNNWTNLATIKDNGEVVATKFTGTLDGNASTATKLSSAKTISLTGDVTGSTSFDGSANASITTTVADDSHNHTATTLPVVTNINKTTKTATNTTTGWFTIAKTPVNNEFWSCRLLVEVKASISQWQTYELDLIGCGVNNPTARLMQRTNGTALIMNFRLGYPKAANNGYGAFIDIYSNVTTNKTIKVTLLQSENVELTDITDSIYNSTYHNVTGNITASGSGIYGMNVYNQGSTDTATNTQGIRSDQYFNAGENLVGNDMVALGIDGKFYKVTNTTASFDARTCLVGRSEGTYNIDSGAYIRHLGNVTPLAAYTTENEGITAFKPVYVEGTLTNAGVFTSNGKVTCTLTNGKSYMRIGVARNTTTIYLDKNCYCFSLDEDGFLTNYNGFGIGAVRSVDSGETCDLDIE